MALTVVTGPPAAGKTTWVNAKARPGDIVIDYDRIAQALTVPGASTHEHGRYLKDVAFRARSSAITEALRISDRVDVFLIHTDPKPDAVARYLDAGAHIVTVDPGRDVVMDRVRGQRSKSVVHAVERWYAHSHAESVVTVRGSRVW